MPQTQLSVKKGSDNSIFGLKEQKKTPKSRFDFSKKIYTTLDIGGIVPVDWFDVFPGDRVKLSIRYLLDTLPLEVPPFTSYYVRTHWYYIKKSALWKGWNTFITRGRSGNIDLKIPSISAADAVASYQDANSKYINLCGPNSLFNYLGLKPIYYNNDNTKPSYLPYLKADTDSFATTGHSLVDEISALPFMAYQKICRFNYMPSNLLQNNKCWFPDDLEDHWYIGYNGENLNGRLFVPESATMPDPGDEIRNFVPSADSETGDNCVDLFQLRFGLFERDLFTDGKPWLVRGAEVTQSFDGQISDFISILNGLTPEFKSSEFDSSSDVTDSPVKSLGFQGDSNKMKFFTGNQTSSVYGDYTENGVSNSDVISERVLQFNTWLKNAFHFKSSTSRFSLATTFSANTLRNLLAMSVWQERNTLSTDGNYNKTIQVHWNEKPKAPEYAPMYIGGTSDLVSFGQVIQQSSSVSGSPLGTKAGFGMANNGSEVFNFTADDYGVIMGVMIISPDVVYSDGIGHEWTDLTFDEQYQPEFANLGYQPILNREVFVSGNKATDEDLFAYQTRYAYLKMRLNQTCGLFDLTPTQDNVFGPYVQARRFSSTPELSNQFVTMSPDNVDRSFLSYSNLPAFKLQFASDVDLVRALPYQSTPETFGF